MRVNKKYPRSVPYRDYLVQDLKEPKAALAYLNAVLNDGDEDAFLVALRDVAEAHGGISRVSKLAKIHRVTLHRIMSKKGNPRLHNLANILHALGLKLAIVPEKESKVKYAA